MNENLRKNLEKDKQEYSDLIKMNIDWFNSQSNQSNVSLLERVKKLKEAFKILKGE